MPRIHNIQCNVVARLVGFCPVNASAKTYSIGAQELKISKYAEDPIGLFQLSAFRMFSSECYR